MDSGVMALGTIPIRGTFNCTGEVGIPIQIGGVELAPGRFVYCDLDGVIVSSRPLWPAE